jgi:hypothetical protein
MLWVLCNGTDNIVLEAGTKKLLYGHVATQFFESSQADD